jgi:hypothetical protein
MHVADYATAPDDAVPGSAGDDAAQGRGGINAHITLDLDRINAVLAGQVDDVLRQLGTLSPALADLYAVLREGEQFVVNRSVAAMRDSAWRFACLLAVEPHRVNDATLRWQDGRVAAAGGLVYEPPGLVGVLDATVRAIAARENRDVAHNIAVLDQIADTAAALTLAL